MFFFEHQLKVRLVIVGGVAVFVVNNLVALQIAPDARFHHQPVDHHVAFTVGKRVFGKTDRAVTCARPVSDLTPFSWHPCLRHHTTFKGAEQALPVAGGGNVFAALPAYIGWRYSPAAYFFAGVRAYSLRTLRGAAILWVEFGGTHFALQCNRQVSHTPILPPEEKYCEIAALRLAQEVMDFS